MWVDGIIAIIVILTMIQGYRYGFVQTVLHTVGWVLAVVLGFVWYPHVIDFLRNTTGFYDPIHQKIAERISESAGNTADSAVSNMPEVIRSLLSKAMDSAASAIANTMSDSLTNLVFNLLGFLVVALIIKLILMGLTFLFSKEKNAGIVGGIDGILGLFAGVIKGGIIVYILLALMVPVTSLTGSHFLIDQLNGSVLGSYLYDNNLILQIVKGFL